MTDQTAPTDHAEPAPAHQVSMPRWAEHKRAYVARLPKSDRAALAAANELAKNPVEPAKADPFADPFAEPDADPAA